MLTTTYPHRRHLLIAVTVQTFACKYGLYFALQSLKSEYKQRKEGMEGMRSEMKLKHTHETNLSTCFTVLDRVVVG